MEKNINRFSESTFLGYWMDSREIIRECLRRTPDNLLAWKPKDDMRTFGQLYVHVATSIDWWLTNFIKDGGQWIPSGQHPTDDRAKLDQHLTASFARLGRFAMLADLSVTYKNENGEDFSGYWLLIHLFEHDNLHCGQLKTYLRMNGIAPPEDK